MNTVLLQKDLDSNEIRFLEQEFPQLLFLSPSSFFQKNLSSEDWAQVEILYGNALTKEELLYAHNLRWIHSPSISLEGLCLNEIKNQENILITTIPEENVCQVGEFVLAALLNFSKNLCFWTLLNQTPELAMEQRELPTPWRLENKILVQIGLGAKGSEIARLAALLKMRVFGLSQKTSFHPYCNKNLDLKDLRSVLPLADVVCICLPQEEKASSFFRKEELDLMKKDSCLLMIESQSLIDQESLLKAGATEKFRGILFDASPDAVPPATSKLWKVPKMLITPGISEQPKSKSKQNFSSFHYNLRQYLNGNFAEMRNKIQLLT